MFRASTGAPATSTASLNLTSMRMFLYVPYTPSAPSTPTTTGSLGAKMLILAAASERLLLGSGNDMPAISLAATPVMTAPLRIKASVPL